MNVIYTGNMEEIQQFYDSLTVIIIYYRLISSSKSQMKELNGDIWRHMANAYQTYPVCEGGSLQAWTPPGGGTMSLPLALHLHSPEQSQGNRQATFRVTGGNKSNKESAVPIHLSSCGTAPPPPLSTARPLGPSLHLPAVYTVSVRRRRQAGVPPLRWDRGGNSIADARPLGVVTLVPVDSLFVDVENKRTCK